MQNYSIREAIPVTAQKELQSYPELLRTLLFYRGVETALDAEKYLNPHFEEHCHDPFLMKDMTKAVDRLLKAIENKEKVIVYSDYDADGIPGAVVMSDFLKKIGFTNFEVYIPHRHLEGFGLHSAAIDTFKEKGATLLITIDCGIADVEEVIHAQSLGIDVIITDHHLPVNGVPEAFAVLDSKQDDCQYPYKMLCGSGVIFKFIQAVLKKNRFGLVEGSEKWLLDMVGIATCADMVPLQGENRVFAYYGLKVLRKSPRIGLMKLLRKMKVSQPNITEDDIGFMIAPRINAASRMGIPMEAFNVLTSKDEIEAGMLTEHLHSINEERKGIVASIVKELNSRIEERVEYQTHPVLVMGDPRWKPSLLGLAANTLMEKYKRPVFLWGREDGTEIKGSCRSDGSADVVEVMQAVDVGVFTHFGGHAMSGGFAVTTERIHHLEEELHKAYVLKKKVKDAKAIFIDKKMMLDEVDWNTFKLIEKMMPFGLGNEKPLFMFENIEIDSMKQFGKKKDHLELTFHSHFADKISAIGFFATPEDFDNKPAEKKKINLIASLEKSVFGGRIELRLRIVDIV